MNFKQYLLESGTTDLHAEIDKHIENGSIPHPAYQMLKRKVERHIEKKNKNVFDAHRAGKGDELHKVDHNLPDLVMDTPKRLHDVPPMHNKLEKIKAKDHPLFKAAHAMHKELSPLVDKMKHLKTMAVKTRR